MEVVRYATDSGPRYGELAGETVVELSGDLFDEPQRTGREYPRADLRVLPPVIPSKFILVSLNYEEALVAHNLPRPPSPILFLKAPSAIISDGAEIRYPKESKYVTFEPELALVIGRECRNVSAAHALDCVFGYTCTNDLSARDIQEAEGQYTRCKSFDTFGPLGPSIVTNIDAANLRVTGYINGEKKTERRTCSLIFDIPEIVSFTSHCMTLYPGDVISTGAGGVAEVVPGDVITVDIEAIGRLTNRLVA